MVPLILTLAFAVLGAVVFLWKRRHSRIGPQEARMKARAVRLPPNVAAVYPKAKLKGAWALYLGIPFGLVILTFFFISRITRGYDAYILMKRGKEASATVTISGFPREECHYELELKGTVYRGRGPERLKGGDQLVVRFDPSDPSRNRPAKGIWFDLVGGAFLAAVPLLVLAFIVIPRARPSVRENGT